MTPTQSLRNVRSIDFLTKLVVCLAILLICLIVIGGVNYVSFEEYFFSHPPKRDVITRLPVRSLPALSATYFQYYSYSWLVMLLALPWGLYLIVRNTTTPEQVAIYAACVLLACIFVATSAITAIYLCNQTLVFNLQHRQ